MFKVLRPIKTLLLIVVFMILAVVASVNFNTNEEQKDEMKKGILWQAGDKMISSIFSSLNFVSSFTSDSNIARENAETEIKESFVSSVWQDFKAKVSNISLTSFFDNFKAEKLNFVVKDEIKEEFVNIIDEAGSVINHSTNLKSDNKVE